MRYSGAALMALIGMMLFVQQPAHSDRASGVIGILYPPLDCETDFDYDFWTKYDSAMLEEWNISSQTLCLEGLNEQEKEDLQSVLQRVGQNVIIMSIDNVVLEGMNHRARGVAQPSENFGIVEFNYEESSKVLSHETLHLMLEQIGYPKSCYVDAVHENAYRYARYYDSVMIIAHFDC